MARMKKSKGKQKITMGKIEKEEDRLVTFSKRRSGINKKASELITLCGAEIGILVFSPSGKPFSFGHPSLESIANRFLRKTNIHPKDNTHPLVEAHRMVRVNELTQQYSELLDKSDAEKERGDWLKRMMNGKEKGAINWWDAPIDERGIDVLKKTFAMFEELHTNLSEKVYENITNGASCSSPSSRINNNHPNSTGLMMMMMMKNPLAFNCY